MGNAQGEVIIDFDKPLKKEARVLLKEKTKQICHTGIFSDIDCKVKIEDIEMIECEGFRDLTYEYSNEKVKNTKDSLLEEVLDYYVYQVTFSSNKNCFLYVFSYNIIFDLVEIDVFEKNMEKSELVFLRRTCLYLIR